MDLLNTGFQVVMKNHPAIEIHLEFSFSHKHSNRNTSVTVCYFRNHSNKCRVAKGEKQYKPKGFHAIFVVPITELRPFVKHINS